MNPITVSTTVKAPLAKAWEFWTDPVHIVKWNFASDDWECPSATNDLKVGGIFSSRMQAKDGSAGFDFAGTYTAVEEGSMLEYEFGPRKAKVVFEKMSDEETKITETFDPENINPEEMQRAGWQAILENFKKYVESK